MKVVFQFFRAMAAFAHARNPLQSAVHLIKRNDRSTCKNDAGSTILAGYNLRLPLDSGIGKPLGTSKQPRKEGCCKKRYKAQSVHD
jgi:hypothetical protein